MTVDGMGDGRSPADRPRTNRADEQSDGRERRMRSRGMAGVNDRRPVILVVRVSNKESLREALPHSKNCH